MKLLREWGLADYYVYLRPASSRFSEPDEKNGIWWVVTVQIRALPPHEFREEGRDLDAVVKRLGKRVPLRDELGKKKWKNTRHDPFVGSGAEHVGFLAPHALWLQKYRHALEQSTLFGQSVRRTAKSAREARSEDGSLGPIYDRYGDGKPTDSTVQGYGTDLTTPDRADTMPEAIRLLPPPPLPGD